MCSLNGGAVFKRTLNLLLLCLCVFVCCFHTGREGYENFVPVDAVYALPVPLVEQLGIKSEMREARPLPLGPT